MLARCLAALALAFAFHATAQTCGSRLFVSGWNSTVHVFDACTGAYIKDLDTHARLDGAMAVRVGPDALIYVVAEATGAIHRYRNNDNLDYVDQFANVGAIGATGLAFDTAGNAYVAGYRTSDVRRLDRSGAAAGTPVAARASGLVGPDNGMTFGPDGNLYIPSYDGHSVIRWDPRTNQTSVAVPARSGNLANTRGLLTHRDGAHMFITSEGSGRVLKWNLASGAITTLATGLTSPTGIDYAPDGKLFVSDGDAVARIDPDTGARLATFIAPNTGGIAAQVFLAVIPRPAAASVDATQVGSQYWVVGDARFANRVLQIDNVYSATGTAFGPNLRASELAIKRWGSVRLELTSCTQATFSWDSSGTNSAGFGSGSYTVYRYFENEGTARCLANGIDAADKSWVNGQWWGRESRSGEGLFLDRGADGTTFFAWFTHRPR